MKTVTIPLSEYDIEVFKDIVYGRKISLVWVFQFDNSTEDIQITFVQEEEDEDDTDEQY